MRLLSAKTASIAALMLGAMLIWVSCGDGNGSDTSQNTSTPPPADATTSTETPRQFNGTRDPIEKTFEQGVIPPVLVSVAAEQQSTHDRIVFEFEDGAPNYRIEYVDPPITACGSGLPVEIEGEAFLQVRLFPAMAHDLAGSPTVERTTVEVRGPSMIQAVQTCDFEGEVVWVLGVTEQVDVRDFTLLPGVFRWQIVVDTKHP